MFLASYRILNFSWPPSSHFAGHHPFHVCPFSDIPSTSAMGHDIQSSATCTELLPSLGACQGILNWGQFVLRSYRYEWKQIPNVAGLWRMASFFLIPFGFILMAFYSSIFNPRNTCKHWKIQTMLREKVWQLYPLQLSPSGIPDPIHLPDLL